MNEAFIEEIFQSQKEARCEPSPEQVANFFIQLLQALFPELSEKKFQSPGELKAHLETFRFRLIDILCQSPNKDCFDAEIVAEGFFKQLPQVYQTLKLDISAMFEGDPAAKSKSEVIRTYPGFYAIAAYRIAHILHKFGVHIIPRIITEHAHSQTGIDIHPGAQIGSYFCIDHGTGIVIGETTIIGDHVKIYQGVTLGALSVNKEDAKVKRHPTIEDHVVIYAGATILGGETVVGHHSVVGGNVWLPRSIEPYTKIYYKAKMHNSDLDETDLVIYTSVKL